MLRAIFALTGSPAQPPDLATLQTGFPMQGNRLIKSEMVSFRGKPGRAAAPLPPDDARAGSLAARLLAAAPADESPRPRTRAERAMSVLRRGAGALSRRLGRPELLAAVDPHARQAQREEVAIRAVLAASLQGEPTYVDAGTNRGQVLGEAALVAPRARLIAFEPIPALAAGLRAAFPGLDCRELALGAEQGARSSPTSASSTVGAACAAAPRSATSRARPRRSR